MNAKLLEKQVNTRSAFKTVSNTLTIDAKLRARRELFSRLSAAGKRMMAIATLKKKSKKVTVNREVYTANNMEVEPGQLVRKEGQRKSRDKDVNNAYDGAGLTWDFYYSLFGRNSIDGEGMKIIQTVHYANKYNNAFWDGQQMVYGDGDGKVFGSFTTDLDVIGHELTHGIVQYETNLVYKDEAGALNESLADIFGIMIKQKANNQDVNASNWLVGENIILGKKYALRSLKAPGTAYKNHPELGSDPQPAHFKDYTNDPFDNGGVHLNSGIPNHAFYLACKEIGGFSWEKVGRVWYATMCDKKLVPKTASFADFKNSTLVNAKKIFKADKAVEKAINNAWTAVGV
jgi:Zn-dependent metalloprotease